MNPTPDQERTWAEQKKLCAARWAWPRRRERAPLPMHVRPGEPKREVTWATWFRLKFGEPLQDYVRRQRERRAAEAA